jgi:hypothetical protein
MPSTSPSPAPRPTIQQIEEEQRKIGEAIRKWTFTDPVKADEQLSRNRELRLKIEGQPVLSSSYGW